MGEIQVSRPCEQAAAGSAGLWSHKRWVPEKTYADHYPGLPRVTRVSDQKGIVPQILIFAYRVLLCFWVTLIVNTKP